LHLSFLNDLGPYIVAAADSVQLATHLVPVDSPHAFVSFFDQMKQEYVSARWHLYEGLTSRVPHLSDKDVFLLKTEPRPVLSFAIENVKTAYKTAYSIFDKIGFFVNAYMDLKIPEKQVSFRSLWRSDPKKPIRKQFDTKSNWGFCALYWLAKDFFEKETDEVAEPQARYLCEIRNYVEHKYLRITESESQISPPPDDLALALSRKQFESKAVHLLKLARSALIYLAIGVGFEEKRREPGRAGPIEQVPTPSYVLDSEKI
jgi:hypothetical protein